MKNLILNPIEFQILSGWNRENLTQKLMNLAKQANPQKEEITEDDLMWSARMLEMDLQAQHNDIWEISEEEDQQAKRNLEIMQREGFSWAKD